MVLIGLGKEKTIDKNMYKHGLIKSTWSDTDNGLDAMIKFKDICVHNNIYLAVVKFYLLFMLI